MKVSHESQLRGQNQTRDRQTSSRRFYTTSEKGHMVKPYRRRPQEKWENLGLRRLPQT